MILILVVILISLFLFEGIRIMLNPLTRSEEKIREKLLTQTPLGTSMEEVVQFVEKKEGWVIDNISNQHGFDFKGKGPRKRVGVKSIQAYLGEYRIITNLYLATDVTVFYGFNEKAELIDIWVWKTIDGL